MGMTAREAALLTLSACERQGAWSDGYLNKLLHGAGMDSRDAALATRLCYGVIQNRMLLDHYMTCYSSVKPEKMEPDVRNVLRLGIYQILFLSRVPERAAVNESVELVKKCSRTRRAAGLVNGVLRTVAREKGHLPGPDTGSWAGDAAILYSHPKWLVEEFLAALGREETEKLLAMDNEGPATAVQVNTVRTSTSSLAERLEAEGVTVERHPWLEDCLLLSGTGDLERLESFREGLFYVQDPAARLAVMAAAPQEGLRVLDVCAAPGGKSFACAVAMAGRGEIISCDIHPNKERRIRSGAERLGFCDLITAMTRDGKEFRQEWAEAFPLVICDVPCSGLGVIRKKPDIRYKDPAELEGLPRVQGEILRNAARYVAPGGALLYATCTLRKRENQDVVQTFLGEGTEFFLQGFSLPEPVGRQESGMLTLWPQRWGTDGFFIAKLRRRG